MPTSSVLTSAFVATALAGVVAAATSPGPPPGSTPRPVPVAVAPADVVGAPSPRWVWPLSPAPAVVRGYDEVGRYAPGHRGVDLAATAGQPVLAPVAGRVSFAGAVAGRRVLVITADDGLRATLEPVAATVAVGTRVVAGTEVGTVDVSPVHCPSTCLHLGARLGEVYRDPLPLLRRAGPPVLLPLGRVG
ncbi:murein hydrolase activator EnvC family protein [Kineococcus gynurae]|uniref:Murein hydrolase activator EnvC family protein n=1 Tax=Kineococcus gynurae TaxID=452979 RepID=A0ABV5LVK4_9ACTN